MNASQRQLSRFTWALLVLGAALACTSALAADNASAADSTARYQQERAMCMSGQSNQDRATCMREAGAALAQAKRGGTDDGSANYSRNASKRCDGLPDEDRKACMSRMMGQGTTSGSVAGGGIYRELVTTEVGTPSAAKAGASAPAVPMK